MLRTFEKYEGQFRGFGLREYVIGLPDGKYAIEIERVDLCRSMPAHRLYFAAIVQELTRYGKEEGDGKGPGPDWYHEYFKRHALPVILAKRERGVRSKRRFVLPSGKVGWETTGAKPKLSTKVLNSREQSEYIQLCCDLARTPVNRGGLGYPYEFDFLNQPPNA